jgi:hypothetical protein
LQTHGWTPVLVDGSIGGPSDSLTVVDTLASPIELCQYVICGFLESHS